MKIAILYDKNEKQHTTSWSVIWKAYCDQNGLQYTIINPYKNGVIEELLDYDIILWHYSNYIHKDLLMAKNILNTLEFHGKKVFPSFNDAWHFDDKLAETYLLESINAPMPKSFYYYEMKSLEEDLKACKLAFPIIAKLRNGSGSHNVKKIDNAEELRQYAKTMFSKGLSAAPSLLFKASSNIKSSKNIKTFINRAKRIPEFLKSLSNAKKFNREVGYVYLQEFIPNDGFDIKITVVGDKLSYFVRNIREDDFRASGGGDFYYDREKITKNIIDSAFETSHKLGFQCMGYDYVVDRRTGEGKIVEISYGFSHLAVLEAKGYFDKQGIWHDESMNVPFEIIKNLIAK
ncbi:RimK family alpha-L-glutamate ligase [Capnocytophaga canis]|uniref:RimK family alpha-L-glutamate ligase n=1 Tax=Capnocytophaga canis TaxID=1848903 RepID=UPI0037D2C77A